MMTVNENYNRFLIMIMIILIMMMMMMIKSCLSIKRLSIEMFMRISRRSMRIEEEVVLVELIKIPKQGEDAFYLNLSLVRTSSLLCLLFYFNLIISTYKHLSYNKFYESVIMTCDDGNDDCCVF